MQNLLIVDNNRSHVKLVELSLAGMGYCIRTAANAEETIQVLKNYKPQLILMGMQLSGIDGIELTRSLKNDSKYHDIIIVAVTAYGMKGDKEIALHAGCDGYISKPIDVKTFPQLVAGYLKKSGNDTEKNEIL